jgi:hypothetical protein
MANIANNKNTLTINILSPKGGVDYIRTLPTTPENGRPSLAVAQSVAEVLEKNDASEELREAFADWMDRAYPRSAGGSPGAKGMAFGSQGRSYKAAVLGGDADGTASVRVPVAHLGVRHGEYVHARAMTRTDAIALLNRLDDDRVIFLVPGDAEG